MKEAIQKAIEGGYNVGPIEVDMVCDNKYDHHFLSPLFWQALGKAMGWKEEANLIITLESYNTGPEHLLHQSMEAGYWRFYWHRFIDHLAEGKDAESFFSTLLK